MHLLNYIGRIILFPHKKRSKNRGKNGASSLQVHELEKAASVSGTHFLGATLKSTTFYLLNSLR